MRIKEFTGKTTQEAIDNGLAELGVTIADVHVDVLQEGAKGVFGLFGSKPACVRLTVMEDEREDDHGLSDLLGSFSLNEQKKKAAPKPAHANDVMPKMVELEFQAIAMATMVMSTSVMREHHMTCFSVASFLNTPRYRVWLTALAEISR